MLQFGHSFGHSYMGSLKPCFTSLRRSQVSNRKLNSDAESRFLCGQAMSSKYRYKRS